MPLIANYVIFEKHDHTYTRNLNNRLLFLFYACVSYLIIQILIQGSIIKRFELKEFWF